MPRGVAHLLPRPSARKGRGKPLRQIGFQGGPLICGECRSLIEAFACPLETTHGCQVPRGVEPQSHEVTSKSSRARTAEACSVMLSHGLIEATYRTRSVSTYTARCSVVLSHGLIEANSQHFFSDPLARRSVVLSRGLIEACKMAAKSPRFDRVLRGAESRLHWSEREVTHVVQAAPVRPPW